MTTYQVMPDLTVDEYADLKADIASRGVMIPIEYDEQGNILDGYHRLRICEELGIKEYPKVIRSGMSEAEKLTHARKLNLARRHLTTAQKQELIREQLKDTPEQSDRQIAKALGVHHTTVTTQRKELEAQGQVANLATSIGTDGKEYPRKVSSTFIVESAEPKPEKKAHVSYNTGNNEWYTPQEYITLVRSVMGSIDVDPASTEKANEVVQASTYYTAETEGLSQAWRGNIWMNPPYSADLISKFTAKLTEELDNVSQAIVLVNNATETEWFNELIQNALAVCSPKGRIKFYGPDGQTGAPLQGQAVLYFGANPEKFIFYEYKLAGAKMPHGQELALTRLVNALTEAGKLAVLFQCGHEEHDTENDICGAASRVERVYWSGRWYKGQGYSVKEYTDRYIMWIEKIQAA